MKTLERLTNRLRRPDPRLEAARRAHASGDFAEARRLATEIVAGGDASLEAVRGLGELEYLHGAYGAAEALLRRVVEESGRDRAARIDAEAALALVYLQTNRFAEAHGLFAGVDGVEFPIWELMRSFGDEQPYRLDWPGDDHVTVPFTQATDWELPSLAIDVDGVRVDARLDTGGELLTLDRGLAEAIGLDPVARVTGVFAGGARGSVGYGMVDAVSIGGLEVRNVPVAVLDLDRPVIGTGFLRQFLATIDYPGRRLVLRPRGGHHAREMHAVDVPFALAVTHLIVARGSLDDKAPLTFVLDSGLQDESGSVFTAPTSTLAAVGIPIPETTEDVRETGAGRVPLQVARFPIRRLGLGPLVQHDLLGFYGLFPDVWQEVAGFQIHGLVSHGFLRRYAWTLDFDAMRMTFVPGGAILRP